MLLNFRNRRVRIGAIVVLLAVSGVAIWWFALRFAANRQYRLAQEALERCDFKDAGIHLQAYLALRPGDSAALLTAAQTARRWGDLAKAEQYVRKARERGGDKTAVTLEETLLRIHSGNLAEASRWIPFCEAKAGSPEAAAVLEALIAGSLRTAQVQIANWGIKLWLKHGRGNLDQARGRVWRGRLYELLNLPGDALVDYRRAVELAPDYLPAHFGVAALLVAEDVSQAGPDVEWLLGHFGGETNVRLLAAQYCRRLGQLDRARQLLDGLLAAEPGHVLALLERAHVALDLGLPQEAEPWLVRALEQAPSQIEAASAMKDLGMWRAVHVAMSDCLRLSGRADEAKSYQEKAQRLQELSRRPVADHAAGVKK